MATSACLWCRESVNQFDAEACWHPELLPLSTESRIIDSRASLRAPVVALLRGRCSVETMIARCCGLDVHKARLTACVRMLVDDSVSELVESFGTTTCDLLALRDWLRAHEVTHVAMESTGVYWKCVYYLLEDDFELLLVNARHIKHVPVARPTRSTRPGSRSCWPAGCCGRAWCRRGRSAS